MKTIKERAENYSRTPFIFNGSFVHDINKYQGYVQGAVEQQAIDTNNAEISYNNGYEDAVDKACLKFHEFLFMFNNKISCINVEEFDEDFKKSIMRAKVCDKFEEQ